MYHPEHEGGRAAPLAGRSARCSRSAARRAAGATLFLVGTNFAALMLVTLAVWVIGGGDPAYRTLWWTLVAGCSAFGAYLVVIAIAPRVLARRPLLAPFFEAGLRGHLLAVVGRFPYTAVIVLAPWIAIRT